MGLDAKKITWALGIAGSFPPVLWKVTPQRLAETAAGRPPGYDGMGVLAASLAEKNLIGTRSMYDRTNSITGRFPIETSTIWDD